MQDGGFYQKRQISPTGIGIVVLLHGAAITALALTKMDVPVMKVFTPLEVFNPKVAPPEPVPVPPDPKPAPRTSSQVDTPQPRVPTPSTDFTVDQPRQDPVVFDPRPMGEAKPEPRVEPLPPPPVPEPVRVEAKLKGGDLQPPYPASEQRLEREGKVVVRVLIGADGRVKAVERVSATSNAFFEATERHALRTWRFTPASEDGRPIESRKTMSITFRLED